MPELTTARIRAEFTRLGQLETFRFRLGDRSLVAQPPALEVARYNRDVRKRGHAELDGRSIKLLIGTNVDWFDVQETLIHELAHVYVIRRWPDAQGHGPEWRRTLVSAFKEAFPGVRVPSFNRHHGPFSDQLRQHVATRNAEDFLTRADRVMAEMEQDRLHRDRHPSYGDPDYYTDPEVPRELTDREKAFIEGRKLNQDYVRPAVIELPQPLRGMKEPGGNIGQWIATQASDYESGRAPEWMVQEEERRAEARREIQRQRQNRVRTSSRYNTRHLDGEVMAMVRDHPGQTRERLDALYEQRHGPYPGRSTYNSLWRLRRDNYVHRDGNRWYPVEVNPNTPATTGI